MTDPASGRRRVFLSYHTETGVVYAHLTKCVLEEAGFDVWYWIHNHTDGEDMWEGEILPQIKGCDFFVYLCTSPDAERRGQREERHRANHWEKPTRVITLNLRWLPLLYDDGRNHTIITPESSLQEISNLAQKLAKT